MSLTGGFRGEVSSDVLKVAGQVPVCLSFAYYIEYK